LKIRLEAQKPSAVAPERLLQFNVEMKRQRLHQSRILRLFK